MTHLGGDCWLGPRPLALEYPLAYSAARSRDALVVDLAATLNTDRWGFHQGHVSMSSMIRDGALATQGNMTYGGVEVKL
ncbi:hypothetical protein Sjap_020845 [Stephania japonica]|uniref:Uncharacterized protein n=1 Tax=Stephania japonica TaxID=461633 RepID=A0AAP0I0L8_9MAGN